MKKLLEKYKLEKLGLHNGKTKMCLCGREMDINEKVCPGCNTKLTKTSLLNISKNSACAKRFEESIDGDVISLKYYHLLSNAFELYESLMLELSINKTTSEITISDQKLFKSLANKPDMEEFFEKHLPGFISYVINCLSCFTNEYAYSSFYSLSSTRLSNFLNVYLNYNALSKYLLGYKVFYYGSKINLKKYYPTTDFNNIEDIQKTNLNLELLKTWDIKNEKYIETIIDISNTASEEQLELLNQIITEMIDETKKGYSSTIEYNDIVETFGLLYNNDISLDDFLRIKNNSHNNYFCQFNKFKQNYKKCVNKTIDWSTINGLDRKTIGILETKANLIKTKKVNKSQIEAVYEELEKDPVEALKELAKYI